ncbi:MAG: hypothetical protein ACE15E_06245 [Acidobacteriota bacterium]
MLQTWIAEAPGLIAGFLIAWILLRGPAGDFDRFLGRVRTWAERPVLVCLFAVVFPIGLRLAFLPWSPAPHPIVHDEFSHLLLADTLAHGRLANPSHPFWEHFETIYVLQQPTYSSIYPLGQGAMLAAGEIVFGHPWAGVLLGITAFNLAFFWMMRALLPATWSALGCLVAMLQFEIFGYWINSYWGGALAAAAGSLFFGAVVRFLPSPRYRWGLLAGVGVVGMWHTRPFETIWLTAGVLGLILWRFRRAGFRRLATDLSAFFIPVALCLAFALFLTGYHNYRVTGHALTLPYQLSQKQYGVPMGLIWEKEGPAPKFRYRNIEDCYRWQKEQAEQARNPGKFWLEYRLRLGLLWLVYVSPSLTIPFAVAFIGRPPVSLPMGGFLTLALLGSALYPFLFPHYLAGYACLTVIFLVSGLRTLWSAGGRARRALALGSVLTLAITAVAELSFWFRPGAETRRPHDTPWTVAEQLRSTPGKHLIFVRYSSRHDFTFEWVYNEADIDQARVVWAREISPEKDRAFLEYFRDRRVWVLEPDTKPLVLRPYHGSPTSPKS